MKNKPILWVFAYAATAENIYKTKDIYRTQGFKNRGLFAAKLEFALSILNSN